MASQRIVHDASALKAVSQTLTPKITNAAALQHAAPIRLQRPVPLTVFQEIQEYCVNNLGVTIAASTSKAVGPHPLTNGYKDVAISLVEKRMKNFQVRIIGPSAKELCSGKYHHYCIGCFDARDAGRLNDGRRALVNRMAKNNKDGLHNHHTRLLRVLRTGVGTSLACASSAVYCNAKAEFLYLPHSIYDIHPEQLETIMYNSDIRTAYAIILCPLALEAGRLEGQDTETVWQTFNANDEKKLIYDEINDGDYLRMCFVDGSGGYTHKMNTLSTWLWASGYKGKRLNFLIERQRVGNQLILRINASKLEVVTHHIRGAQFSRTVIPDAKYMMLMTGLSKVIPAQPYHDISTKLYQKIIQHGLSRNGKTFDYNSFVQYCRSNMTTITVGGEQVFGFSRTDVEELTEDCILSLFIVCTAKRLETRTIIDKHRDAVENLLKTGHIRSGFFTDIGHAIGDLFSYTTAMISTAADTCIDAMTSMKLSTASAFDAAARVLGFETRTLDYLNRTGVQRTDQFHDYLRRHNRKDYVPNSWYAPSFCAGYRMRHVLNHKDRRLLFGNVTERKFIWETFEAPPLTGVVHYRENRIPVLLAPLLPENPTPDGTPLELAISDFCQRAITEYTTIIANAEYNMARQAKRNGALPAEQQRLANLMEENAEYVTRHELKYTGPITLVSAGPGCGKTHKIVNECRTGDFILTASRAAMEEINKKIAQRQVDDVAEGRPPPVDVHAYTPHLGMNAAILNRTKRAATMAETLWVDEAFLQHPGHALCVASVIQARRVVIVGDYRQISVKDFEIGQGNKIVTHSRWNMLVGLVEEEELLDNYRLPPMIVEALNVRFGYRMIPKSKIEGNFTYHRFNSFSELPGKLDKDAKTVTFLQAHKAYLNTHGIDTSTCHEVQGPTFKNVNFVLSNEMCEKFNEDAGYLIVGLSRATDNLHVWVQEGDYALMQLPLSCEGDIDALMDLSRVLTPCTVPVIQPRQITTMLIEDVNIHRPRANNTDPHVVDQILQDFGQLTISGGDWTNLHVAYPVNNPKPAPKVRLYTDHVDDLPDTVTYSRLTKSNLLQYQENGNLAFKLRTWLARNAGSRRLVRKPLAKKVALQIFNDMRKIFYKDDIKKLTDEELNEGLVTFWHNIQERSKCPRYAEIVGDLFDLGFVEGFVKQQVKGQWSPTDDDAFRVLEEAVRNYRAAPSVGGKAGQGVAAWSKARNVLMAAWISAIEKRTHKMLHPYFIHATDMSDEDLLLHLTETMQTYGFVMAFKGDDVVLGWIDADGRWVYHETDQSKFDASFSAIHYALEAQRYAAFGMPAHLILSNENHSTKYSINENANLLRIVDVMCGNCSGKPQTLSLNSFISMCIASQMYEWDCSGRVPIVKFSGQRQTATEQLFGVEIKHASGEVGSFVGFLLTAGTALPDIFRAVVKTVTRRIYTQGTVDKITAIQLRDEGWAEHELFVAKCVKEQAAALHSRFSGVKTESVREACILANLKYYYPQCAKFSAFYYRVQSLLDFIQSYADNDFTKRFVKMYLDNVEEMRIYYVNNEAAADNEYTFVTDEEVENIIHMLNIKEKNFVSELVAAAAAEDAENAQMPEDKCIAAAAVVDLLPFSSRKPTYQLPSMHRLALTVEGQRFEPVPINKTRLKTLGMSRAEYNFRHALHHHLGIDFYEVTKLVEKNTNAVLRSARKHLDLKNNVTVAAYYHDLFKIHFAVETDDRTLCSTTDNLDDSVVIIDNRGHYVKRQTTSPAIVTAPITRKPRERINTTRPYTPNDRERRMVRGELANLEDFFAAMSPVAPNSSSLHGMGGNLAHGRRVARTCRNVTDYALNFNRLIVVRDGNDWTIHGRGNHQLIYFALFNNELYHLIHEARPTLTDLCTKPPAANPAKIGILLDDGTYQPTAEQIKAPNIIAPQRTAVSCFYAAVAAAFRRQLGAPNITEELVREELSAAAAPAERAVIDDPEQMAPYNAVDLCCEVFSVCIIERRPKDWVWTGDRDHPKIMLNWRHRHWNAVDVDLLTLEQNDATHSDLALPDDFTSDDDDVSTASNTTTQSVTESVTDGPTHTDLDLFLREKFEKTPEVDNAAGYHCPLNEKNVNRLRSILGHFVPALKTGQLTVTVAGDAARGIARFLAGYDGVKLVNDYTGGSGGPKIYSWAHDLFDSSTYLPSDIAILHYNKLSPSAYQSFAKTANIIITFVDLRDELSGYLDTFGGYIVPAAAKLTSSRAYHINSIVGLPGPVARQRVRDVWINLLPATVPHFSNQRCRQDSFIDEVQRLLYLDVVTADTIHQRCTDWRDAGFTAFSDEDPGAPVHIDFHRRTVTYNEAAAELEFAHPEFIDDNRRFTVFKHLGREIRVLAPGEFRPGIDSAWSQNAADEGGPDGIPLPFYLRRLEAANGDCEAALALIAHCGCEFGNERPVSTATCDDPSSNSSGQSAQPDRGKD